MADYALTLSDAEIARYRLMAERAAEDEAAQWAAAGIVAGAAVADVGCGPGAMTVVLAEKVGPTGRVVAVDRDPNALAIARLAADAAGLANVTCHEGDADATGLPPGSVDVVMLRHVLAHNGGREQAIVDHLASLVRPGGAVYLLDIEATAMRVRPVNEAPALLRLQEGYGQFHAQVGNDLSVGLRLGELLEGAGLDDVHHRGHVTVLRSAPGMRPPPWAAREQMLAAGVISEAELARCEEEFGRLDRGELNLTMFVPLFTAFGRKPA